MLESLEVQGLGPVRDLAARFGERLNILTGDNGLGKSFLLDIAFWSLTGSWPGGRVAIPEPSRSNHKPGIVFHTGGKKRKTHERSIAGFNFHTQAWTWPRKRAPLLDALVIYAAVDGSFSVWNPARHLTRPNASDREGFFAAVPYQFDPDTLANGLTEEDRTVCNGLIQDWVTWYYQRQTNLPKPFELLEGVIQSLSHPQEPMRPAEPSRVFVDDTRKFPTLDLPYGKVAFPHWAAGIRRVISLAYLLVWSWVENQQASELRRQRPTDQLILIVDEAEAHLHPKWQRTLVPALLKVSSMLHPKMRIQVFASTHSPLILASMEPHFDEQADKLFWFDLQEGKVYFRDYPWAVQGDVVGWLTSPIFGLQQARSREAEIAVEAAEAFMRGDRDRLPSQLKTKAKIQDALEKTLPGIDPFWPRWIVEARK